MRKTNFFFTFITSILSIFLVTIPELEPANSASATTLIRSSVLQVGKEKQYAIPSEAAAVANDGDIIEIDASVYEGDVAVWRADNLTIRGVGGKAHLKANGKNAQGKGIWVIKGDNTIVENIEFSGATVPDRNGAGIRQEGSGLTVRKCYFHDNENGILGGGGSESRVLIEYSEFANNGYGDGYSHNMYIGKVKSFTLRYSYSHHAKVGHNVKSRAQENYILYNRIMDEKDGNSSYTVNLPNGGTSYLIGNLIQQGLATENSTIISYAEEGGSNPSQKLYVVNNTIVNDRVSGRFIRVAGIPTSVKIVNNIFAGEGKVLSGVGEMNNNLTVSKPLFVDRANFDYHLKPDSSAIDAGISPVYANDFNLIPVWQYVHPVSREKRPKVGNIDIGAYEFKKN